MNTNNYTIIKDESYGHHNGAWHGSNSSPRLWGKNLAAAVRTELKKNAVKGVTVSCETYSGGQSLRLKFKPTKADFVPLEEFVAQSKEPMNFHQFRGYWLDYKGRQLSPDECLQLPEKERDEFYKELLTEKYLRYAGTEDGEYLYSGNDDFQSYKGILTEAFIQKLRLVNKIVMSYNYDDSDSLSDYFDRGFYEKYILMPMKTA